MSLHVFNTETHKVLMGYDRALNGIFMTIEHGDVKVYVNSHDSDLLDTRGFADNTSYYEQLALNLGIKLPKEMLNEIEADKEHKIGNKLVTHYLNPYRRAQTPQTPKAFFSTII